MAAAHETLATTHLGATTFQGDNRQGSRKRKQNMPSSGASSDTANRKPTDSMSQLQIDKKLSATIKAVASFDFPEAFVLSCALDMKNSGRDVTSSTLFEECEQRFTGEATSQTNTCEVDHAGCKSLPGSEQLGATSDSTQPALICVPSETSTHNSMKSSHSANSSSGSGTQNLYSSTNTPTKESELSRPREANGYKDNTSHSAQNSSIASSDSIASADSIEYGDSIDGCLPVERFSESGFNAGVQSGSDSINKFNAATVLFSSETAATGNVLFNLDKQDSESMRSGSGAFKDVAAPATVGVNNVVNGAELGPKGSQTGRDSLPGVKASSQDDDKYKTFCFEVVEKELALLRKLRMCLLCSSRPRDVTFLPCGHFTSCQSCAESIDVCPCCNKPILTFIVTYLSSNVES